MKRFHHVTKISWFEQQRFKACLSSILCLLKEFNKILFDDRFVQAVKEGRGEPKTNKDEENLI